MQIWPAIDIRNGKCVRLLQGDYDRETVYGDDPVAMAARWIDQGANCLHLVDLDGARDGAAASEKSANQNAIQSIASSFEATLQVGGGVRDRAAIETLILAGVDRVVIGTRALTDPDWTKKMIEAFPGRLVIGIDARDGLVATDGWRRTSGRAALDVAREYAGLPIAGIVFTDIHRDGMLQGPNFEALVEMNRAVSVDVIASGGVSTLDDVRRLAELDLAGAIVGRALYEDQLNLAEALEAVSQTAWTQTQKSKSVNE